ncbi:uncharacterized protein F4822DRAFT_432825 [Hypoxylon trugodes]|uniref:uncharacterized protein n=1 Tax=Hypoxylon trugodes TaxID=326681 RepID=UPI00219616C9|nr:uncharacterized protein F4822DRAFT_432825 [Hypoxylon trugodes]KAI1385966.1 hypothetical protein F4822DRAFT_432825 [Hypoxylon trugodes]
MADNQDHIQQEIPLPNFPYPLISRRMSLPRRNTETNHWEPHSRFGPNNLNKPHRRFSSVLKASDPMLGPDSPGIRPSSLREEIGRDVQSGAGPPTQENGRLDVGPENESFNRLNSPSVASTSLATVAPSSRGSNSSGEGASTATERPFLDREAAGKATARRKRFPTKQPNALNFLDSDSPTVTAESIRRSMEEASRRSPTSMQGQSPSTQSASSASSVFRDDDASDTVGENETDRSTSPEHNAEGADEDRPPIDIGPRMGPPPNRRRSHGFPELSRENSEHSHGSPSDHTPREPNRGRSRHVPRNEKLPLSGYELLASKLATPPDPVGPNLRPIYRRFEMLNHRMLLYLQDELCELEEQLHRLDAADTQNRRLPNCIFPASRRAEFMAGGELHWRKSETLGKIGFKLDQYSKRIPPYPHAFPSARYLAYVYNSPDRILSSFRETQRIPAPTMDDIREYRHYLITHNPIAEAETHFLDPTDDLVCISDEEQIVVDEDPMHTPIPPPPEFAMSEPRGRSPIKSRPVSPFRQEESIAETVETTYEDTPVVPLSVAVTVAVILPILTFLIIPGYLGRLTVVFLVGLSILGGLIQGGIVAVRTWELLICVGLYGAVMAVIAGIV